MTSSTVVYKSAAYDNPSYTSRQSLEFGPITAGSGGQTVQKFVAKANLQAYSLSTYTTVVGTSTYTFTAGGTGTVAVAATQVSLIVITNTARPGSTVALATTTFGPYTVGGNFVSGGTQTNQIGQYSEFQLNTNTGTAGLGGVTIPQGSQMYIVNGTDATAVEDISVSYQIVPGASVAA
jgi:hypothetical protein